jgi:LmbE family N-acetylglucosaminyl deacetylase
VNSKYIATCLAAFVPFTTLCPITCLAEPPKAGGYATVAVTTKEVVEAADFAIKAHQKVIQDKKDTETPKLELVTITQAEQQVVAGINYRLHLKVKLDGKEKMAEALVWWQAWRNPDPYQLTSWTWK